jgi:hypothetical protein
MKMRSSTIILILNQQKQKPLLISPMKRTCFLFALLLGAIFTGQAQVTDLEENKVVSENGFEFSYSIKNERTEETYSRYEITAMVTNKTGCTKMYIKKESDFNLTAFDTDPSSLAKFECTNATGKRLTSKSSMVKAKSFSAAVTVNGTRTTADIGYMMKNNQRATSDFIVIVPKGERPKFQVRAEIFTLEN